MQAISLRLLTETDASSTETSSLTFGWKGLNKGHIKQWWKWNYRGTFVGNTRRVSIRVSCARTNSFEVAFLAVSRTITELQTSIITRRTRVKLNHKNNNTNRRNTRFLQNGYEVNWAGLVLANTSVKIMKPVIAIRDSSPKRHRASFCGPVFSPISLFLWAGKSLCAQRTPTRTLRSNKRGNIISHVSYTGGYKFAKARNLHKVSRSTLKANYNPWF